MSCECVGQNINTEYSKKDTLEFFGGDELAADVYLKKYALTNREGKIEEYLPSQMWKRLSKAAASVEKNKEYWEEQFYEVLEEWKAVPQGSIMFALGNPYQRSSCSNCFVLPNSDSLDGIFDCAKEMAKTYSYRGGVGTDLSNLRPENSIVSNAARTSTGAWSFMDFYSYVTRLIGQHGRRGALMLTLSDKHPDLLKFITAKIDKTKVTGANISVRISDDFMKAVENDGEWILSFKTKHETIETKHKAREIWDLLIKTATETAEPGVIFWDAILRESPGNCYADDGFRETCTNPCCFAADEEISVITQGGIKDIKDITKDDLVLVPGENVWAKTSGYFSAGIAKVYLLDLHGIYFRVTANHKFEKINPTTNEKSLVKLSDLSPGDRLVGLFNDFEVLEIKEDGETEVGCIEVEKYHKFCANGIVSGNSELPLPDYDACTLLSMNLTKYVDNPFTKNSIFNFKKFKKDVSTATRFLDNTKELDIELMPLDKQKEVARKGRRIGMGTHGLADTLAQLCYKYDTQDAIDFVSKLYEFYAKAVYQASVDLAEEKGAFPIFNKDKEKNNPFLNRIGFAGIPRRNMACLTCAPTGSVACISKTSSGVEPTFRNIYTRRRKITHNEAVDIPKSKLHKDKMGDLWQEYKVAHHNVTRYLELNNIENIDDCKLPDYFVESHEIDWSKRVQIQAALQKFICHSISSTINLPKGTPVETVKTIYMEAWKAGLKGITVYVEGCRDGVLISNDDKNETAIQKTQAPKRPKDVDADVYHLTAKEQSYFIMVGLLNGEPYEVFAGKNGIFDKKAKKAIISKIKRGHYKAILDTGENIDNISDNITEEEAAITRLISLSLRHGADIKHCVDVMEKVPGDMHNFARCIARTLKKYIPEGTKITGTTCGGCGSENLARTEGCKVCIDCGWTACS